MENQLLVKTSAAQELREALRKDRDLRRLRAKRLPRNIGKPRKKACGFLYE
jgi:hypothetical protein